MFLILGIAISILPSLFISLSHLYFKILLLGSLPSFVFYHNYFAICFFFVFVAPLSTTVLYFHSSSSYRALPEALLMDTKSLSHHSFIL